MLPAPRNYAIFPRTVPADRPCDMVIVPTEKAFLLTEGAEYRVLIISMDRDDPDYRASTNAKPVTATVADGALRFTYTFPDEQEHLVRWEYKEKKFFEFRVFSLRRDLYTLRPLKADFHAHSYRSDGCQDPAALAGHFREQGYDCFALTDHNRYYPGGEIDETYAGVKLGLTRIMGEEVHAPDSVVHIVHVGGQSSVADLYVHGRDTYENELADYLKKVPAEIPEQYAVRYACAAWATDKIHEAGGVAIFAHPFWKPGGSRTVNVTAEFSRILLKSGMFDAFELVGGQGQEGINRALAMWQEVREEGAAIPVVGSSDVHGLEKASTFPHMFTICFAKDNTNEAVAAALKAGRCVAVEATGDEYARHYRCYGSFRLVTYAQFLLRCYFPELQRVCQGEGIAMRSYAFGDAPKSLVEGQVRQTDNFRLRFFGRKAPAMADADMCAFERKWRAVQLEGPITKGSAIDSDVITRQI